MNPLPLAEKLGLEQGGDEEGVVGELDDPGIAVIVPTHDPQGPFSKSS
jgi:hypothetical protein